VEILEAPCSSEERLKAAVDSYRDLGLSIAMDDFGAGSSNLARVERLRPDVVKIDRSMLAGAVGADAAGRMLPGMVELLHQSQAKVAIEGIETREEALVAIEADADYLQGYFLAAPDARLHDVMHGTATLDRLLHHPPGRSVPTRELAALR
jgi:EAL domain-containing protein (putative c-di-GMP-specific phosphodiesterase class I)